MYNNQKGGKIETNNVSFLSTKQMAGPICPTESQYCEEWKSNLVVKSDAEKAIQNAARNIFPEATIIKCEIHAAKAVKRTLEKKLLPQDKDRARFIHASMFFKDTAPVKQSTEEEVKDALRSFVDEELRSDEARIKSYLLDKEQDFIEIVKFKRGVGNNLFMKPGEKGENNGINNTQKKNVTKKS